MMAADNVTSASLTQLCGMLTRQSAEVEVSRIDDFGDVC